MTDKMVADITEMIAPFIKIKAKIYALATRSFILPLDGTLSPQYHFSATEQAVIDQCDKAINFIRDSEGRDNDNQSK